MRDLNLLRAEFCNEGGHSYGTWWGSEDDRWWAYLLDMYSNKDNLSYNSWDKSVLRSVRCVRD
jgi:hypothetical protein